MRDDDTIAAIATAAGVGGVGIVRVSGPLAVAIGAGALAVDPDALDRRVRVGWVRSVLGERVDQVLAFAMRGPASFTGEDVVELQGHGGPRVLAALLASVVDRGARVAEPGEFTRRAVANGKLDLPRAEALLQVIQAGSERAWRIAKANLSGALGAAAATIEARALGVLAEIEGGIDFPESDLDAEESEWVGRELSACGEACARLAGSFASGRVALAGVVVALVGKVNAGKSSLLNALVGSERALVAAEPGTTRDWIEVPTMWNGVAVTVVDTAGLRETTEVLERRGIELGAARVKQADVVLVVDADGEFGAAAEFGERAVTVRSKCDLGAAPALPDVLETSAVSGAGLEALKARVLAVVGLADREGSEDAVVTTARQHGAVVVARAAFAAAREAWAANRPSELVAIDVRGAVQALAELRGVEVGERVLDEVFARFCIGK